MMLAGKRRRLFSAVSITSLWTSCLSSFTHQNLFARFNLLLRAVSLHLPSPHRTARNSIPPSRRRRTTCWRNSAFPGLCAKASGPSSWMAKSRRCWGIKIMIAKSHHSWGTLKLRPPGLEMADWRPPGNPQFTPFDQRTILSVLPRQNVDAIR
jgi:hypothetical protein